MRSVLPAAFMVSIGLLWGMTDAAAQPDAKGEALFRACQTCHSIEEDGENKLGPNLWGVYGAMAASKPDFAYSAALKKSGIVWTDDNLSRWLAGPSKFLPGTKMGFPGLKDEADRQAVIAYLKSNSGL